VLTGAFYLASRSTLTRRLEKPIFGHFLLSSNDISSYPTRICLIGLLVFDYSEELFDPFGDGDPIVWDNICGRGFLCLSEIKIILLYVLIFGYFRELLAVCVPLKLI
jgi:hypothetical protein